MAWGKRRVVASYAGAAGLCTASRGSKSLFQVRGQGGRRFTSRCRGSMLRLPVQRVVASPAGAVGRCLTCRCSGSLLRMPGQRESRCGGEAVYCTASRCGARHRRRKGVLEALYRNPGEVPISRQPAAPSLRGHGNSAPGLRAAQVTPEFPPGRPMARRPAFDAQLAVSSTLRAGGPRSVGHRVPCGQSVAASPVSPASPGRPRSVGRRVAGGQSVAASAAVSRSPRGRGPAHAPGPRRPVRASPS